MSFTGSWNGHLCFMGHVRHWVGDSPDNEHRRLVRWNGANGGRDYRINWDTASLASIKYRTA